MTIKPKQPRGPGGKFAKAEKPVVAPTSNNEAFMAGIERDLQKSIDEQSSGQLDRAHRMKWIGIALAIVLLAMLIVAAIAWPR